MREPVGDTTLFHISFKSALKTQTALVTALCAVDIKRQKGRWRKEAKGWLNIAKKDMLCVPTCPGHSDAESTARALWMLTGNIYAWSLFPSSVQRYLGVAPPTLTMHFSVTESGIQLVRNKTLLWMKRKFLWSVSIFHNSLYVWAKHEIPHFQTRR